MMSVMIDFIAQLGWSQVVDSKDTQKQNVDA